MARSNVIWIVLMIGNRPAAAFTVKHEMIEWLDKQPDKFRLSVWRYPDNPSDYASPFDTINSKPRDVTKEIKKELLERATSFYAE